jgi:hypothetical protein
MEKGGMWMIICGVVIALFFIITMWPNITNHQDKVSNTNDIKAVQGEINHLSMRISKADFFYKGVNGQEKLEKDKKRLAMLEDYRDKVEAEKYGTNVQTVTIVNGNTPTVPVQPVAPITINEKELAELKAKAMAGR